MFVFVVISVILKINSIYFIINFHLLKKNKLVRLKKENIKIV